MEVNYTNGYVVLPKEEYDRMNRDIDKLHKVIKLSKAYDDGSINVEYNNRLLYTLAVEPCAPMLNSRRELASVSSFIVNLNL